MAGLLVLVPKFQFESGPTLVLGCDHDSLQWLKDRFHDLSELDQSNSFSIGNNPPIESDGMSKLVVTLGDNNKVQPIGNSEFAWSVTRESALEVTDKLSAMLTSSTPGHQYLDNGIHCGRLSR